MIPRQWARAAALSAGIVAGCANDPTLELHDFHLRANGRDTEVHVPSDLRPALLDRPAKYSLATHVVLPPEWRDRDASLVVPTMLGLEEVRVGGTVVHPLHGEVERFAFTRTYAFPLSAANTRSGEVDIELRVAFDAVTAAKIVTAPRLCPGGDGDAAYRRTHAFNEVGWNAAIYMLTTLTFVHGFVYALDRRRRAYGWGALFSALAALLTWLNATGAHGWLGTHSLTVGWSVSVVTAWAAVHFYSSYLGFETPKALHRAPLLLAIPWILFPNPFDAPTRHHVFVSVLATALLLSLFVIAFRGVRAKRKGALAYLVAITVFLVIVTPDILSLQGIADPLGGLRFLGPGYVLSGFTTAMLLARDHHDLGLDLERRAQDLDAANTELRRQIAERSRELSDALAKLGPLAPQTGRLSVGDVVDGRYRIARQLGVGGMGAVYEAERMADGKRLALKVMLEATHGEALARFAREAQIAAEIAHPNVVSVVDVGVAASGVLFLVTELIDAGSLDAQHARFGERSWALPVLAQIARGVHALHRAGVIHRDLKPANVLMGTDGRVRIADFGIAALKRTNDVDVLGATKAASDKLTQAGALLGTPAYMAPELARGAEHASTKTDVFAFGVLAYEMLTGKPPFAVPPVMDALVGRSSSDPAAMGTSALDLSLLRALAIDPDERPSMEELVLVLA